MFFKPALTAVTLSDLEEVDLATILALEDPTSLFDINPSKISDPEEKKKYNKLQKL